MKNTELQHEHVVQPNMSGDDSTVAMSQARCNSTCHTKDNQRLFDTLRQRHSRFDYCGYSYSRDDDGLHLRFDFRIDEIEFHPTATLENRPFLDFNSANLDLLVFNIGMVELVSYWKCACPPQVRVMCGSLDADSLAFWRKLFWHGLGEFFYTNGISADIDSFMKIECTGMPLPQGARHCLADDYLVPIGGGKDSVVSLELLRRAGRKVRPLVMNPRGATIGCAAVAGFPLEEVLVIRRAIDPQLLRLNAEGYLNGHTPFSAMLAFYTLLASELAGVRNIALSNESSANESTVPGSSVNHQYSKSIQFEDDFRRYAASMGVESNYFSFLRPLTELQIASLFSRLDCYHSVFRSCNAGSKQDVWCGRCAKCLFAYIILSPFIAPARLAQIFGKPMLDDLSLQPEFDELVGNAPTKPFECVGTVSEVRQALAMAVSRWYGGDLPLLLRGVDAASWLCPQRLDCIASEGNLNAFEFDLLRKACSERTI